MGPGSSWWAMPACTRARSHRARLISAERAWRGRFFFSSGRRHTRWNYDWSSDVCSSDLKATLTAFARRFFTADTRVRFRPSFFPFTEPSAEMDVQCQICKGTGCATCKQTGWMEILGSGMVHPAVLDNCGVDSERYTGYAWGMGPHRIAMTRHGIPDIRLLFEDDVRFLTQFARPHR